MSPEPCTRPPTTLWTTCECLDCRRRTLRLRKQLRTGLYMRVPTEDAWAEVMRLAALGWSSTAIASSAGIPYSTIRSALQSGRRERFSVHNAAALVNHGDPTDGMVGVAGTRRRLQGLACQAWDLATLAERSGIGFTTLAAARNRPTKKCRATTYTTIRDVTHEIGLEIGPAPQAAVVARAKGWTGLVAWDDIDTDARPANTWEEPRGHYEVDHAVVWRVLDGQVVDTTYAERLEIMRQWLARGGSERDLARRMGWKEGRYVTREDVA